jgi:hypothetical protein
MILSELRDYIKQRQQVSLADIANHFNSDEQALRAMLDVWIKKGRIVKQMATASCGSSCHQCQSASTEYYCWAATKTTQPLTFNSNGCP